ncbi:MAG: TIGR00725 family protein [Actinomycetia bacterium]|nr:TIGR00725 family protein [Actinomycetes bacterium]
MKYVAISGPGEGASSDDRSRAYEAAGQLVSHGCVILTGGLGGVMAAAAAGAKAAGGTSIAILPGLDRGSTGDHTFTIPTGLGELRNGLLIRAADGVLIVGGSWGTLSEYAFSERTEVPVVTLGGWVMDPRAEVTAPAAATVGEAVDALLGLI